MKVSADGFGPTRRPNSTDGQSTNGSHVPPSVLEPTEILAPPGARQRHATGTSRNVSGHSETPRDIPVRRSLAARLAPRTIFLILLGLVILAVAGFALFGGNDRPDAGNATSPVTAPSQAAPSSAPSSAPGNPSQPDGTPAPGQTAGASTGQPGAGTSPQAGDDIGDGIADPAGTPGPTTAQAGDDVREFALEYAASWLNKAGKTAEQWRAILADRSTGDVNDLLTDTDLENVPTGRLDDTQASATVDDQQVTTALIPITAIDGTTAVGTLELTVVTSGTHPLVAAISYTKAGG
jgi:hypothetical protein